MLPKLNHFRVNYILYSIVIKILPSYFKMWPFIRECRLKAAFKIAKISCILFLKNVFYKIMQTMKSLGICFNITNTSFNNFFTFKSINKTLVCLLRVAFSSLCPLPPIPIPFQVLPWMSMGQKVITGPVLKEGLKKVENPAWWKLYHLPKA